MVALDSGAVPIVRDVAKQQWAAARFATCAVPATGAGAAGGSVGAAPDDLLLHTIDGQPSRLSVELDGADVAVMVATASDGAAVAEAIGLACTLRGIMTAGVVCGDGGAATRPAVTALRPHARVLMVTSDEQDVAALLSAFRA